MPRQIVETPSTTLELADGILRIRSKGVETTRESLTQTFRVAMELSDGRRIAVQFDARLWPGSALGGWVHGISNLMENFTAVAMIIDSANPPDFGERLDPIDRLMIPFRVFTTEAEADAFLRPHVERPSK